MTLGMRSLLGWVLIISGVLGCIWHGDRTGLLTALVVVALGAALIVWGRSSYHDEGDRQAVGGRGLADELERLDDMHSAGSLTDEEYAAAKARLLAD